MIVTELKLANLRAVELAEFHFQPGFNLVVGVNGVGKTTVLDALRICFSRILPSITESQSSPIPFKVSDIRAGLPFLDAQVLLELGENGFRYTRRQWRERFAKDNAKNIERMRREILNSERLRDRPRNLLRELEDSYGVSDRDYFIPPRPALQKEARVSRIASNCVFFSTNRAVVSEGGALKTKAVGGTSAAYAEGLVARPMRVGFYASWMRAQIALASEVPLAGRHIEVLREAVSRFLPDYKNLRPSSEDDGRLVVDHAGVELDVGQLSDGERGVMALVLDLARRLSIANQSLEDPLKAGEAIVLIDEIDLHLHPKWQRQIVRNLVEVFPQCQFIATTHSPQVIGEVEHDRIQIIADGLVYSPTHSFGVDSSRVLEEIMNADQRTREVNELLSKLSHEIGGQHLERARALLAQLAASLGEDDPEVIRSRTLIDFVEGNE
jgi:ABC-type multidrug transport system ATPase subunit